MHAGPFAGNGALNLRNLAARSSVPDFPGRRCRPLWVVHASRVLAGASSRSRTLVVVRQQGARSTERKVRFGATPKPTRETRALSRDARHNLQRLRDIFRNIELRRAVYVRRAHSGASRRIGPKANSVTEANQICRVIDN